MNLSVKTQPAQPKPNYQSIIESIESHVTAASKMMDFDDTRYFTMRDATEVSVNLFLALELLQLIKK